MVAPNYISSNDVQGFSFLYILTNTCYVLLLIVAIQAGVRWYFVVVFISISLMSAIKHLLMDLLAICMSSLGKCLFKSSHWLTRSVWIFCCWVVWTLCISETSDKYCSYEISEKFPSTLCAGTFCFLLQMVLSIMSKSISCSMGLYFESEVTGDPKNSLYTLPREGNVV